MLSIDHCRKLLKDKDYSNDEIEALRDNLYNLANAVIDIVLHPLSGSKRPGKLVIEPAASEGDLEAIEERAAIIEFDGGLSRAEAQRVAMEIRSGKHNTRY